MTLTGLRIKSTARDGGLLSRPPSSCPGEGVLAGRSRDPQTAVHHFHNAVAVAKDVVVVGDHDGCDTVVVALPDEEFHDLTAAGPVQGRGRFIHEKEFRPGDERPLAFQVPALQCVDDAATWASLCSAAEALGCADLVALPVAAGSGAGRPVIAG